MNFITGISLLKVANGCALGVELLPIEEDLGADDMMLTVRRRLPGKRNYGDWSQEVIWDTSRGATVATLRGVVADAIGEAELAIRMAKRIPDKFDWLVIPHSGDALLPEKGIGGAKKKRRKGRNSKPGGQVCDLKSSPFYMQDGDVIGVKVVDEPGGDDSDFGSADDDAAREKINSQWEEKFAFEKPEPKPSCASSHVEAVIKIHVDNFR